VVSGDDFAAAIGEAASLLSAAGIETARLDAEVLLAHAAGIERAGVLARLRDEIPQAIGARFDESIRRRARREPLAYVTGEKEFFSLSFHVTPDVLIPRPETESLVEEVLRRAPANARVLDVGTGSGCIAVALAVCRPDLRLTACDVSPAALAVAVENARRHGAEARIRFVASDLFGGFDAHHHWHVIVSNPPYVAAEEELAPELAWEPTKALRAGADGMAVIRRLLVEGVARLADGGRLLVEIGAAQGEVSRRAAREAGLTEVEVLSDLAGHPRLLIAAKKS
jgi:release factor glutamine methyltransferase